MAISAPAACSPAVLQQIRHTLAACPIAELGALLPSELQSLAELICALSEPGGAFRAQFDRLSSREELVALAATRGIPIEPSLLERFQRFAVGAPPQELADRELSAVCAGRADPGLQGFQLQLVRWLDQGLLG
jgi:hypothetical protein